MRWFCEETLPEALKDRRHFERCIDEFWKEFAQKIPDIEAHIQNRAQWDLYGWMVQLLDALPEKVQWEFGPAIRIKGRRLVFSGEGKRHAQPFIDTLVKRAPEISGWEFYPYRLPEKLDTALLIVKAKGGTDASDLKFRARLTRNRKIELTFATTLSQGQSEGASVYAAISLLGDEVLNRWVGNGITIEEFGVFKRFFRLFQREKDGKTFLPISELKRTVDALIASVHDQLPSKPLFEWDPPPQAPNTDGKVVVGKLFKIDRKLPPMDDYPLWVDLYVGTSPHSEIFEACILSTDFASGRFSKCGELFTYLKIDGRAFSDVKDRGAIEDAIDDELNRNRAGGVIGGGTGHVYSYILLAIVDLPKAIRLLKTVLQAEKIPKRTWLLFFDAEYWDEWVGIWDDTPPPPCTK